MASYDYQFTHRLCVRGTVDEVRNILSNPADLPNWWSAFCLNVQTVEPGDGTGMGYVVNLRVKGWLPYVVHLQLRGTEVKPNCLKLDTQGDLEGHGVWTFEQDGAWVNIRYDWTTRANKPLLRNLSFVLKPLLAWNHHWAMASCEESLQQEMDRRKANNITEFDTEQQQSVWDAPMGEGG